MVTALHLLPRGLLLLGFVLLAFVVAFVVVTYAHLFLVTRDRAVFRAVPRELAAATWLALTWPLFPLLGARYHGRAHGVRPIVLLHGYGMNRMCLFWLGRALAKKGMGPLVGMSYNWLQPVARSAEKLAAFVEEACARYGASEVNIVCHSLGGLVSMAYVRELGGASRVKNVVTIATPHQGTRMGLVGIGKSAADLRPQSKVVQDLWGPPPKGVRLTTIYSPSDNLVVPPESARGGEWSCVVRVDDHGHGALLVSSRVVDAIVARLMAQEGQEGGDDLRPAAGRSPMAA
ncbi:MAG: alpha/beta fold hydrolase [Deltaproteobacteria bacterium]|nr:alpha/beta fold hydrolase [Deltaproteobacteria bacterium]